MSKRVIENYNSQLIALLSVKPIAFNPLLSKVAGSAKAGIFMSQLLYWWGKGEKTGWIYKTIAEIEAETTLSRNEQDSAIKIWKNMGILELKRAGIPPKRHFKINEDRLLDRLQQYRGLPFPSDPFY